MVTSLRLKIFIIAGAATLGLVSSAFAQDYGPRDRRSDELNTPLEIEGLELGREAPFLSSDDLGLRGAGGGRGFEIEGPPIGSSLPVLPVERP